MQTDASRERRERYSHTTNISQMYNQLTGYHLGTNRAVFLMLPRLHMVQNDFQTFVQGLRYIEGVQEFFLVVARSHGIDGLSIEASLETAHFPEDVTPPIPDEKFKPDAEEFVVTCQSEHGASRSIQEFDSASYTVRGGTVIDRTQGDPGHNGIEFLGGQDEVGAFTDPNPLGSIAERITIFNYQPASDATVQVMGSILQLGGEVRHAALRFRVHTHSQQPLPRQPGDSAVRFGRFLTVHRALCASFRSGDCPTVVDVPVAPPPLPQGSVVDEPIIALNPALLTLTASSASRLPAMKELLGKIQSAMTNSGRLPTRRRPGEVGFLESDYFVEQMTAVLPPAVLGLQIQTVRDLPEAVVNTLGARATIADALQLDLTNFAARTGLTIIDAGKARLTLLKAQPVEPS